METLSTVLAWSYEHPLLFAGVALICTALGAYVYVVVASLVRPHYSPLRDLPGPKRDHLVWGNLARIFEEEPGVSHKRWMKEFGGAVKYGSFTGDTRLVLTDPTALNHVLLSNAYDFPKPEEVRGELAMTLGKGVLFAEGEDHRRQRRIMQPSFGIGHIRELVPIFFEKTYKLRDAWLKLLSTNALDKDAWKDDAALSAFSSAQASNPPSQPEVVLELCKWLNRVTLDIIGVAGFGYEFNALESEENQLGKAFSRMFSRSGGKKITPRGVLIFRFVGWFIRHLPVLSIASWIPLRRFREVREGFATVERESRKIIVSKQNAVEKDGLDSIRGSKDLIALLLKSVEQDTKASMTETELRGQLTTFLLAGHETTSTALTWLFHLLSQPEHQHRQERLREEIRAARQKAQREGRDELESQELDALPYLDAVTREVLRLESPVSATIRHAARDSLIPLGTPVRSSRDPSKLITHVEVKKGQHIFVPIAAVNTNPAVFGEDADQFRPERWLDGAGGEKIEGNVGVYSNMLTFLAGPRSCIGYRFALLELKAILSVLIDDFAFSPREPGMKVEHRSQIVTRPLIVGEEELGTRMPIRVRRAEREE
ncbi:hypothetical protein JCM8097_008290 [Rhodosporidiobolus ruineniae]